VVEGGVGDSNLSRKEGLWRGSIVSRVESPRSVSSNLTSRVMRMVLFLGL